MKPDLETREKAFFDAAAVWCNGKNGFVRLPLLGWFAYVFVRSLGDPHYQSALSLLNLGFHEIGHLLFSYFGKFMSILGGTILETLIPLYAMFHFYRQKDFFAVAMSFGWLSTVLFGIARYAGDAQKMTIPLVSLSWEPTILHDWNYLLSQVGLLKHDAWVAFLFRIAGTGSMLLCFGFGGWLIVRMILGKKTGQEG
ncbi:MAG TPA: hypothetical protein PLO78_01090 [Candidatus Omnitrophota bacterium]|nr:hypothetical protein [Candidatus Omnitrophota bacterium]